MPLTFSFVMFILLKKKKRRRKKHRGLIDCQPESIICRLVDINKKAVFACACASATSVISQRQFSFNLSLILVKLNEL
jgi:hypothetical protein